MSDEVKGNEQRGLDRNGVMLKRRIKNDVAEAITSVTE